MNVRTKIGNSPVGIQAKVYFGLFLALALVVFIVWAALTGWWSKYRLTKVTQQRDAAVAESTIAKTNAKNADGSAANSSQTHSAIQSGTLEVRVVTEDSVKRIESNAERPRTYSDPDDLNPLGPDSLQELESAEARVRAAQDRLRRKDSK